MGVCVGRGYSLQGSQEAQGRQEGVGDKRALSRAHPPHPPVTYFLQQGPTSYSSLHSSNDIRRFCLF
jgi:hypothetical protein